MAHPSPRLVQLAQRIVKQEAAGSPDPAGPAAAAERACRRMQDHLVVLLGSGGFAALLGRALHLAQREQPRLSEVALSGESAGGLCGLTESLAACTEEEATAAAAAVIAYMLDLLVMLVGEELGMKPVRKLWPEAITAMEKE